MYILKSLVAQSPVTVLVAAGVNVLTDVFHTMEAGVLHKLPVSYFGNRI